MRAPTLLLTLAVAAALAGCAKGDAADDTAPDANASSNTTTDMGAALSLSVDLVDRQVPPGVGVPPATMGIDPNKLELKVGQLVNLTVSNKGNSGHDLVIEGLDVATDNIPVGGSVSVEFTPMEAGTYKMFCSVGTGPTEHEAQGMVGEVVVS